jgi:hypothetical protein
MSLTSSWRRGLLRNVGAAALLSLTLPANTWSQQPKPVSVSLLQLIVNPDRYDGKLVSVVGFLAFGFEGDWLYLHKEDYAHGISADCVRVDRTKQMLRDIEQIDRNYVLIVGVFRREEGAFGFESLGHIVNIEQCKFWSQPAHPRTDRLREMQGERPKEDR